MAPFPAPATHWHLTTPNRLATPPDRMTAEEAVRALRFALLADHQATRDPAYIDALTLVDAGWTSASVRRRGQYVAFSCACPELPSERR